MAFKDIKGQDRPIQLLREHIRQGRLSNAYLFAGPEGVGKKLTAETLAKALNCKEAVLDSCDRCRSCLKINKRQHPDVHILDYEDSEIKIEYIRQLQDEINLRPYEAARKVFIINNAHNLNIASSNAFLKTLEEAAGESLIVLVTDKPPLLLSTIISRCQIIKFSFLKRERVKQILTDDYAVEGNLSHFLAYFYEGRLGSALRFKDSGALAMKNRVIDEFALAVRRESKGLLAEKRQELRSCLNILASWFRDVYIVKIGAMDSEVINLDRRAELLRVAKTFSFSELDNALNVILGCLLNLDRNVNIKLLQSNLKVQLWKG